MLKLVKAHATKADLVYQSLVEAIITNKLPPGTRLIVKDIAEQLSVSDIPVREALRMMEVTGLIETTPYVGAVVATPSPEWIEEVFVMRAALEGMATRTAIPFLTKRNIETLASIDQEMQECADAGNYVDFARLNRLFHQKLIEKSPYPYLIKTIEDLLRKSQYGMAIFGLKPGAVKTSDAEHEEIIKAAKAGDAELAETIIRNQRLRVGKELADAIRETLAKTNEGGTSK